MTNYFTITVVAALSLALAACSDKPADTLTQGPGPIVDATVSRVDSLNGIPGIVLGQPMSAFGDSLVAIKSPGILSSYQMPVKSRQVNPWFAANRELVPGQFIGFANGKLVNLQFIAYSQQGMEALRSQAYKMFGQGQRGPDRIDWPGKVAGAVLTPAKIGGREALQLDIVSMNAAN